MRSRRRRRTTRRASRPGRSREQAFEDCSQVRFVAASVHTSGYIFRQFRAAVERVERSDERRARPPRVARQVLRPLADGGQGGVLPALRLAHAGAARLCVGQGHRVLRQDAYLKEHPYFERLIRPFIERQTAELEDYDEAIGIDDEIEEIKQDREEAEAEAKAAAAENKN
ncbi:hypothetical protein L1887_50195 [Cichorium endivia]|nr:hypothetical protein L1887_50195 [Cichorium endivia]